MLVWFYLTAFAILMGGEVNSEIARELALQRGEKRPQRRGVSCVSAAGSPPGSDSALPIPPCPARASARTLIR